MSWDHTLERPSSVYLLAYLVANEEQRSHGVVLTQLHTAVESLEGLVKFLTTAAWLGGDAGWRDGEDAAVCRRQRARVRRVVGTRRDRRSDSRGSRGRGLGVEGLGSGGLQGLGGDCDERGQAKRSVCAHHLLRTR